MEMEAARKAPHRPAQLAYDYSLFAPADATAPKVCRDFVRTVLLTLDREPLITPATLCTSELVTNVHLHTKGTAMLRVQLTPARLRVSVYDESHEPPVTPAGHRHRLLGSRPRAGRGGGGSVGCGAGTGGAVREGGVVRAGRARSTATRMGGGPFPGTGQAVPWGRGWILRFFCTECHLTRQRR